MFLHFMIDWVGLITVVSEAFQQSKCIVTEVSRKINCLKDDLLHMKTRRGKMLRKFLSLNDAGDEFRGVTIVRGVSEETSILWRTSTLTLIYC